MVDFDQCSCSGIDTTLSCCYDTIQFSKDNHKRKLKDVYSTCQHCNRLIKAIEQYNHTDAHASSEHTACKMTLNESQTLFIRPSMTVELMEIDEIANEQSNDNLMQILNDYIHVINMHNDDAQFEYIFNQLPECNILKCAIFKRKKNKSNINSLTINVMDKIHCYFQHCFDIGYRLRLNERQNINTVVENSNGFGNKRLSVHSNRNKTKFNQLKITYKNNINKYSFGLKFEYGYIGERKVDGIKIKQKYKNLKKELLSHFSISIFKSELSKANIHFNSNYCKEAFEPFADSYYDTKWIFTIEHLLSLMIYCNYTQFQYKFSKTYRTKNGQNHNQFYHLGKLLKISVKQFGTKIKHGKVKIFYHGMTGNLLFPQYISNGEGLTGIRIHCPLSTSSSKIAALNFTNNNGQIIEFGGESSKYFSMACWSDFPSESEYFFIQNNVVCETLELINIIDTKLNYEYMNILTALKYILMICTNSPSRTDDREITNLMVDIVKYRLNANKNKRFCKSLTDYCKKLISIFFNNQKQIWLDYKNLKNSCLFNILCHNEFEWVNLENINLLYPNIVHINVSGIKLSFKSFQNLINYLNTKSKNIDRICILSSNNSVINKFNGYNHEFSKIGYKMYHPSNFQCKSDCQNKSKLLRIDKIYGKHLICNALCYKNNLSTELIVTIIKYIGFYDLCMVPSCDKCFNC